MQFPVSPASSTNKVHHLQLLLEHSSAAIALVDREMRYLMVSRRWRLEYGLGDRDLIGQSHYTVFPEIGDRWKAIHQRCLQGAIERCEEEAFPRTDGTVDWLRWEVRPWQEPSGKIGGLVMITEVITAQKNAELALAATNAALEAEVAQHTAEMDRFFNLTADMLCIAGFDGYFKRINPQFSKVLGYTEAELLAEPFLSFVHPEDQAATIAQAMKLVNGHDVISFENRYRCKDGSYRWLSWTSSSDMESDLMYATTRDITEQKAAEARLREQEQFLRSVFDGSEQSIFVVDVINQREFCFSGWNSAAETKIGLQKEQVLGRTPIEVFGEEQGLAFQAHYDRCITERHAFRYEECMFLGDQETWWFTTLNPLMDNEGNIYRLVGTTTNVTDRKQTEQKLQESQKFLKLLLDTIPLDVFWKDRNGVYLGCNAQAAVLSGLNSPEEIVGKTDYDLPWAETEATLYCDRDRQILASGKSMLGLEESITYPDGSIVWLNSNKVPLRDAEDNVIGVLCTTEDISDRKQSEARLQEYADRQALFNQLTSQIRNSLDLDTVIESTIQAIHRFLEIDYCGFAWYAPDADPPTWDLIKEARLPEIPSRIGRFPATLVGPVDALLLNQEILQVDNTEDHEEPIHRAFLQRMNAKSEMLLPIQNNSGRIGIMICVNSFKVRPWTEHEVELLKAVGDQLAIAIDQAELYAQSRQKSAELEQTLQGLQRAQVQMIQAEKMSGLGQLVAGVAHEINNPVNFIYGNLKHAREYTENLLGIIQLYQNKFPSPGPTIETAIEELELDFLTEDLPKLLSSMKLGAERIRSIVSSLRVFSRMDEAEMKAVDIHEGIDSTLMILHNRIKRHSDRQEIQVSKTYGNLPLVECYAGQLNQVFMNILSNAIDALEESMDYHGLEHPEITICTELLGDEGISIAIADNGPGIPEAIRRRIFDPFFTTKPVGKGTGMGLSISYQIVTERHRGRITCMPHAPNGTEFIISIPRQQRSRP